MGRLEQQLRDVEAGLAAAVRRYHLRAQLIRLLSGVAGSVVLSVVGAGAGPLDWRALGPLALGALWTQLRAIWPTVPWDLLQQQLGLSSGSAAAQTPQPGTVP